MILSSMPLSSRMRMTPMARASHDGERVDGSCPSTSASSGSPSSQKVRGMKP
jgi:hypothetical protein